MALGAKIPWTARATCPKISLADGFFLGTFDRFARMAISLGSLRLILPNGEERLYGSQEELPAVPGENIACLQVPATCSSISVTAWVHTIARISCGLLAHWGHSRTSAACFQRGPVWGLAKAAALYAMWLREAFDVSSSWCTS